MDYQTEQEKFWAGSFGNDYNKRESGQDRLAWKTYLFASILAKTHGVNSVIEFGTIGLNLATIKLLPTSETKCHRDKFRGCPRIEETRSYFRS